MKGEKSFQGLLLHFDPFLSKFHALFIKFPMIMANYLSILKSHHRSHRIPQNIFATCLYLNKILHFS